MPTYEAPLLIRCMTREETVKTLKRVAESIFNRGGFIRKIENLGASKLPYRISTHGKRHAEAGRFIFYFDAPSVSVKEITGDFVRDMDLIRNNVYKVQEPEQEECTFYNENLPPPYRENVQDIIKLAPSGKRKPFQYNSGLQYYPFSK